MRILQSLIFYPRGGSAHVARAIAREARGMGHEVETVVGSLGVPGEATHAATFYAGLPIHVMDYQMAKRDFDEGRDPMASLQPFHPSYEPRGAVPDRLFASVSPALTRHSEDAWAELYSTVVKGFNPDIVHMHHLTPQIAAMKKVLPAHPMVAHLHGTELKMLDLLNSPNNGDRESRRYASFWKEYIVEAAHRVDQLIVVSASDRDRAIQLLGLPKSRIAIAANGVDTDLFVPVVAKRESSRARLLHRSLVEQPRGSDESGVVGSITYTDADVTSSGITEEGTVVVGYVGRFTQVKRVPVLLEAMANLPSDLPRSALVLFGGFPGEWEGEHPAAIVRRTQQGGVHFAGWHTQEELAELMPLLDILVLPSVDESFGLVLVEAFSSGIPVIAVDRGGPSAIVITQGADSNGWLVEPDDAVELRRVLAEAITDATGRRRRGKAGRRYALERYSWRTSFHVVLDVYERAIASERA